jgi:hypothetical protein
VQVAIDIRKLRWAIAAGSAFAICFGVYAPGQTPSAPAPLSNGPVLAGQTFYGTGMAMDALANTTLNQTVNSYRFRSAHTGPLAGIRFFLIIDKPGYAGGNNGTVRVEIQTDDGSDAHNPSGQVLTGYTIENSNLTTFAEVSFPSPPTLREGQLYHVVFSNTDPNPTINYCSIDALLSSLNNPPTPAQPTIDNADWIQLIRVNGGAWRVRPGYSPILQLNYADGFVSGVGYIESWIASTKTISSSFRVRERFTVNQSSRTVRQVFLRVRDGSGDLHVRLEKGGGTLIDEGKMTSAPAGNNWFLYTFAEPQTLATGQTYNLVFSAPSGSYDVFPIRHGSAYGFSPRTYFSDGVAEYDSGSGWVGWDAWGVSNRREQNLQFYFATITSASDVSRPAPPTGLQIAIQ